MSDFVNENFASIESNNGLKKIHDLSSLELIELVERELERGAIDKRVNLANHEKYDRRDLITLAIEKAQVNKPEASENSSSILLAFSDAEKAAIATVATFLLVKGRPKVGKTSSLIWIVSVLLGKQGFPYVGFLSQQAEILWVDSEQSRTHIEKIGFNVAKQFGVEGTFHPRLKLLSLRSYSPQARWPFIEECVKADNRIKAIVIDNLGDLVSSPMDDREARDLISRIFRLIEARQLILISILHTNKSNLHSSGFLGSLAEARSETTLSITRSNDIITVEAQLTRNAPIPPVSYKFQNGNFEFLQADEMPEITTVVLKKDFSSVAAELHQQVIAKVFADQSALTPGDFRKRLGPAYSEIVTQIGKELIKKLQSHYVKQNFIYKDGGMLKRTGWSDVEGSMEWARP